MRRARVVLGVALAVLAMAGPRARAGSDDHEDYDAYKLRFGLFWFYSQPSGSFTSENRTGSFDLHKDVGFNSYNTFYGSVDWKFTRKNHLYLIGTNLRSIQDVHAQAHHRVSRPDL